MGTGIPIGTWNNDTLTVELTEAPPKRFVTLHPHFDLYAPKLRRRAISRLTQEMKDGAVWPTEEERVEYGLDRAALRRKGGV
jgi:hypothetical protein